MDRLAQIEDRIRQILAEHARFQFTPLMDSASKVFLDLSLELHDLGDFNRMAVLMPKVVLGWRASLFLTKDGATARLVASTNAELMARRADGEEITIRLVDDWYQEGEYYFFPLRNTGEIRPADSGLEHHAVVGLLRIRPGGILKENELFFVHKYADLVALSLVQRLLARKNLQHIAFIKKLVADIGHNVIVPNIFFKVYLRRLKGKMNRLKEIQNELAAASHAPPWSIQDALKEFSDEMANANEGLQEEFDHIQKHYDNTSLFLETLLRQSHFEKGRYVLQKKTCNFRRDIIEPHIDRFAHRLQERNIDVDLSTGGVPDEAIEAVIDVGLISQVFANLLSNAVKYARPVPWGDGERKFIAYGLELLPNAFGPGADGVKLNLFSTGRTVAPEDRDRIFDEGYRGHNVEREPGTGHGLSFVREVVELHGGRVGYEATDKGNNFYFILPK